MFTRGCGSVVCREFGSSSFLFIVSPKLSPVDRLAYRFVLFS